MKLRTVVCDDELPALEFMTDMLQDMPEVEVVSACRSSSAALDIINRGGIDLAFFDIEMPELSGVTAASEISIDPKPLLVFATAHPEYAVDAFGIDAIDYILKPFDYERVEKSVEKASRMLRLIRKRDDTASNVEQSEMSRNETEVLKIKDAGSYHFIPIQDIIWVEAAGDYSLLHKSNGEIAVRRTITSLEDDLPANKFARVHRSSIIAIDRIAEVRRLAKGEAEIRLVDNITVRSSRSYRETTDRLIK